MFISLALIASLPLLGVAALSEAAHGAGLASTDCQIVCPKSSEDGRVILPAITQVERKSGEWENILECWSVNTTTTELPDIDNAFRLDWERGFDAVYQYVFTGPSFMPAHPAPKPSLIIMSAGIGQSWSMFTLRGVPASTDISLDLGDLRMPSGQCLRVTAGDIFFSVGTLGRQTAWWSAGTVVSDLYLLQGWENSRSHSDS